MKTCPIKKNFMKIPRFGREGNPYWRGILLFQCKFPMPKASYRFGSNIAAGLVKAGISTPAEVANRLAIEFNRVASCLPVTPP
jgi:hypothetical protein